jgi:hypothetical protein
MIMYMRAMLKDIFKKGRNYPWPRPSKCQVCGSDQVWGHGYVDACFDGYKKPLLLKRYRCPLCGCVIRLRPLSHLSRFQASTIKIRSTLLIRIKTGRWPPNCSITRAGHWLRSLKRRALSLFGFKEGKGLIEVFDHLLSKGKNPVSRSI